MTINQTQFAQVVEAAKAKAANNRRWLAAIDRAAEGILNGELIVTTLAHGALVTSENDSYLANGACSCKAYQFGHRECRHRAAARLWERYEMAILAVSPAHVDVTTSAAISISRPQTEDELFGTDVATSSRPNLIAEIENIWPRACPGVPLYTELLVRFGKSELDMLDTDMLRRVRLAIAM